MSTGFTKPTTRTDISAAVGAIHQASIEASLDDAARVDAVSKAYDEAQRLLFIYYKDARKRARDYKPCASTVRNREARAAWEAQRNS